jgi:hypothetical protein
MTARGRTHHCHPAPKSHGSSGPASAGFILPSPAAAMLNLSSAANRKGNI